MVARLKPELEQFIDEQLKAGRFASRDEVLEAGVARLMLDVGDDDLDGQDIAAIEESEREIAAGQDVSWQEASAALRQKYLRES